MVHKQCKTSFIDKRCDQYGLKVATRDPRGNVDSGRCRFCLTFEREDDNDDCGIGNNNGSARRRQRTMNAKCFSSYLARNDRMHLKTQHPSKWPKHQKINREYDDIAKFVDMDVFEFAVLHFSLTGRSLLEFSTHLSHCYSV